MEGFRPDASIARSEIRESRCKHSSIGDSGIPMLVKIASSLTHPMLPKFNQRFGNPDASIAGSVTERNQRACNDPVVRRTEAAKLQMLKAQL